MELVGVVLVYSGLIAAFLAVVSVVRPIRFLGIRTRRRALVIFGLGMAVIACGFALPAREERPVPLRTLLDEFVPVYQFHEVHSIQIRASRERCYAAIREVGPEEIALFHALTWMRRFGRRSPESILNAPEQRPLIETATRTGFILLADDRERELVLGLVMGRPGPEWARPMQSPDQFKALKGPDIAKVAMNFRIEPADAGEYQVTTETRVYTLTTRGRRAFAGYWRVIYPGSALIRRMWLRAIQRRAEAIQPSHSTADR